MVPIISDLAQPVLASDPVLSDEQRADLWDIFHSTKSPEELAVQLQPIPVPDDTKHRLLQAKAQSIPPIVEPFDKTKAVINQMSDMDPRALALAESHPNVLKALVAAAGADKKTEEPAAPEKKDQNQLLQQPVRPDGLQHFTSIPDGHRRVLASDGGIHDIPEDQLENARNIDPRLQVLNP